jgi:hypothetical protein
MRVICVDAAIVKLHVGKAQLDVKWWEMERREILGGK